MTADERNTAAGHPTFEELTAYHDGELETPVRARITSHIDACPACAAHLSSLSEVDDLGRALNRDLPGADFWPGLEARILKRVAEEGGRGEGTEEIPREEAVPRLRGPSWIERTFGWRRLGWAVATAAALGFVILSAEELLHKSPVEPEIALRSRDRDVDGRKADAPSPVPVEEYRSDKVTPAVGGRAAAPKAISDQAPVPEEMGRAAETKREAKPVGALEVATESNLSTAPSAAPAEEALAARTPLDEADAGTPEASPIMADPLPTAAKPGIHARRTESEDDEAGAFSTDAADEDPREYLALVNERLGRKDRDGEGIEVQASRSVAPPGGDLKSRIAESASRFAKEKSPFRDFQIVYAAAFRALEAGEHDLAARGFEMVSRRVPGSDLARDADYQGRISRVRQRIRDGENPRDVLRDISDRADSSWLAAEGNPGSETCRRALADEKVRITLLEEFDPSADRGRFQERVQTLSRCS